MVNQLKPTLNNTILKSVYCDVLIGMGEATRFNRLSATLKEQVTMCIESHVQAHNGSKTFAEHNKFVQNAQEFCALQLS